MVNIIVTNIRYFLKELKTIFKINLLSNIFSLLSTGLIFFVLAVVISGSWIISDIVEAIQNESEINVYFNDDLDDHEVSNLLEDIKVMDGIKEIRLIDKEEAYNRMTDILGEDASVMEYFDENPFNPFIEVGIELNNIEVILEDLSLMGGIEYIRDNREILDRISGIEKVMNFLGYLIIAAVGISTLVIISHIIRQGIYNNKDQIDTLRLLGAPEVFIAFPFILEGMLLTLGGGILATILTSVTINIIYSKLAGPLPFIPLPPQQSLVQGMIIMIISISVILGIAGSILGLPSQKRENKA